MSEHRIRSTSEEADSSANLKSLLHFVYEDYLKKWIDFRGYLHQRRLIIENARVIGEKESHGKNWRSPLAFAVQGTLLVTFIIITLNGGLGLAFGIATGKTEISSVQEQLNDATTTLFSISKEPEDSATFRAGGRTKAEAINEEIKHVKLLERAVIRERYFDQAKSYLSKFLISGTLFLSAFFFSFFILRDSGAKYVCDARIAYLYLVTSHTFWFNVYSSILIVTLLRVGEYWPDIHESTVTMIVTAIVLGYVIDLIMMDGAARGMRDLGYENIWRVQMREKVSTANLAAIACCFGIGYVLTTAYAAVATAVELAFTVRQS